MVFSFIFMSTDSFMCYFYYFYSYQVLSKYNVKKIYFILYFYLFGIFNLNKRFGQSFHLFTIFFAKEIRRIFSIVNNFNVS